MRKVKTNLTNPPQFDDTLFELKCLDHFQRNGFSFNYEPQLHYETKEKKPDFLLYKDNMILFCECKQVRIGLGKADLKFNGQCNYVQEKFNNKIRQQLFDRKLRLEVDFKRTPSINELDELVKQINQLSDSAKGVEVFPSLQVGNSLEYLVVSQNAQRQFPIKTMFMGVMQLNASEPRQLFNPRSDIPGGEFIFYSSDLAKRRAETLRRNIREAKIQLPESMPGMMIINKAKLATAQQAIETRMDSKEYRNIISCVVNPFDDFWSCYKTSYRDLLFDLFEGFQRENHFKVV